jgi:hypothetical protein
MDPTAPATITVRAPEPSAPPAPMMDYTDYRLQKFASLAATYEIRQDFCQKLRQLEGYEIVIVCDDSGSMSSIIDDDKSNAFGRKMTRWDELRNYVNIVTEIASSLDPDGLDIYFLNRPRLTGISSAAQVQAAFAPPPKGWTPIVRTLQQVFRDKEVVMREKRLLVILATDGQPTDDRGNVNTKEFLQLLKNRPRNTFLSILACTDDEKSVDYMNMIDRVVPGVDVNDDFRSEQKEILKAQGKSFAFSFGDYVVKSLLGPIDPSFDMLDERRLSSSTNCCTIV